MVDPRIAIDAQPLQSAFSRGRGIGHYAQNLIHVLLRDHADTVHSLLVGSRGGVTPEVQGLMNEPRVRAHRRATPVDGSGREPDAYLATSPMDTSLPLDAIWPRWTRTSSIARVAIVYDLIPLLAPEWYLQDPTDRSRYWARLQALKQADLLLCISNQTRDDIISNTTIAAHRVVNVGAAASDTFRPSNDSEATRHDLELALPGLGERFLLNVGGDDRRKNLDALITAYSRLPIESRTARRLVITCHLTPETRNRLVGLAGRLGIESDVTLTGRVDDQTLLHLYQAAELFVFPSLMEGFGLPILEAIRSGTPVIASDRGSTSELVADQTLRFDPEDVDSIVGTMASVLSRDLGAIAESQRADVDRRFSWGTVADRVVAAIAQRTGKARSLRPSLPTREIALVSPVPPQRSGVADYSMRLATALSEHVRVDLVTDDDAEAMRTPADSPRGVEVIDSHAFLKKDRDVPYDAVVYAMGNSAFHNYGYELMSQRPGAILLHEARYAGMLLSYGMSRGLHQSWFRELLEAEYPLIPLPANEFTITDPEEASPRGIYLLGPLIDRATQILTTNEFTAEVARIERPDRANDVVCVGFGYPPTHGTETAIRPLTIGTVGIQARVKATDILIEGFASALPHLGDATLLIAGEVDPGFDRTLRDLAQRLGIGDAIKFLGYLDDASYQETLATIDIGVQLRRTTNGEMSAAIGDLLAAGVPTIVTALGPTTEFPDDVVVKLPASTTPGDVADELIAFDRNKPRQQRMREASREYLMTHNFAWAARELVSALDGARRRVR